MRAGAGEYAEVAEGDAEGAELGRGENVNAKGSKGERPAEMDSFPACRDHSEL